MLFTVQMSVVTVCVLSAPTTQTLENVLTTSVGSSSSLTQDSSHSLTSSVVEILTSESTTPFQTNVHK